MTNGKGFEENSDISLKSYEGRLQWEIKKMVVYTLVQVWWSRMSQVIYFVKSGSYKGQRGCIAILGTRTHTHSVF